MTVDAAQNVAIVALVVFTWLLAFAIDNHRNGHK